MNDSFSSLIDSATSVLILLPNRPYFDQVAAGLSLYLSIRDKKPVTISCPSPMTVGFNRLIGVDRITSELGNKNLTIKFVNYDGKNIEKVKADLDGDQFIMTVIPNVGQASPTREQVEISSSGVSANLIILIGGANDSHFDALSKEDFTGASIVHIGTRTLTSEKPVISLAKHGSSVSELIAGIIKDNSLPLDVDTATNLIMGVEEGSSNFTSVDVTPETFEMFAYLLRSGGQRHPKVKLSPMSFPVGSIPTVPEAAKSEGPEPILEAVEKKEEMVENPPSDWLQPKVYKGTSIS